MVWRVVPENSVILVDGIQVVFSVNIVYLLGPRSRTMGTPARS
jgi:hypothetical protein